MNTPGLNILNSSQWRPGTAGTYSGLTSDQYHQEASGFSNSMAKDLVFESPEHMRWEMDHPTPPTEAMIMGTMVHTSVLEPEKFPHCYHLEPREYPADKGNKPWHGGSTYCKAWNAAHADKPILSGSDVDHIGGCKLALMYHPIMSRAITVGIAELSIFAFHDDLMLKCRPDLLFRDATGDLWCLDIKKVQKATRIAFQRDALDKHYDFQEAWYRYVMSLAGIELRGFIFLAVEEQSPHGVCAFRWSKESVDACMPQVHQAIDSYTQCKEQNIWPGYTKAIVEIHRRIYHDSKA